MEINEDKIQAAKREIYEEAGIKKLKLIKELGSYKRYKMDLNNEDDKSELKTIFMFLFETNEEKLKPIDPRNPKARWVDKKDVANLLTHKKDKEFFLKIKDKI
ncbi:NUDIX hydrolase [Candidatus Woesearchaeota archaeon]|nr:NUDIX hydrolase [Candidatus Woesearchaeota archaeon]